MDYRVIFPKLTEEEYGWLASFVIIVEQRLGTQLNANVFELSGDRLTSKEASDRSTVHYRALAGMEALAGLGEKTIIGLVFAHLCERGPQTAKEIHAQKPFKMKTIESVLWQLRHQGLVESESIS